MLDTPIDLRPAPVTATPGKAGTAVRAAMRRVTAAAAALPVDDGQATGEARAALDEALADLDREVGLLLKTTTQELARARRRERDATEHGVRVSALRRPRRPGPPES